MVRSGKVVSEKNGQLEVCFERPEACAHCNACGEKHESLVTLPGNAPVGSRIEVDMPEKQVLKASAVAYLIPLALLLAGLFAGMKLFGRETWAALTGVICMGASWFILRMIDRRMRKRTAWQPRILAVYPPQEAENP